MTPERWQQVRDVFHRALEQSPAARAEFLRQVCPEPSLHAEVASLLDAHRGDDFLEIPAAAQLGPGLGPLPETATPARIGPYRVIRLIARGGMGAVYLARRDDDFDRLVALKVIKRGMDSDAIVQRFRTERQILARFDHEGIARLLDGGTTDEGQPYLVMEYIEGKPITAYCEASRLGVRERLGLFIAVCAAVQYAHQHLVIHRDLKPGNILVTADGRPKLLDFGIAKILDPDPAGEESGLTATVMRVLTPEYASPEQTRGGLVGTSSDVYALGVLLYELLTGARPYRVETPTPEAIARAVCEQEPERPSTSAAAGDRRRELNRDLDAIVLKALDKDPSQRYPSAGALADDVGAYLGGRPVQARRVSAVARAAKFARRHRLGVSAAAAVLVSLGGGVVATAWQARVAHAERSRAEGQRARAQQRFNDVRQLAGSLLFEVHDAVVNLDGALEARRLLVTHGLAYLENLAREAGTDAALRLELARAYSKLGQVRGDYYHSSSLGDLRGAIDTYGLGRALLEAPLEWPGTLAYERARVLEELASFTGEELGVLGDVDGGLTAIATARRWHDSQVAAYASLHPGARSPLAWLRGQRDLSEADLLVMAGDLTGAIRTLRSMREAVETLYEPKRALLGRGTALSRLGSAQHILAVSMLSRMGDADGARSLLRAALASQQRGYDFRKQAWDADPDWQTMRNLAGQCRLFMGNLAFALGRDGDGERWMADGIELTKSAENPAGGEWGYQWRARWLLHRGHPQEALRQLALARGRYAKPVDPHNTLARNAVAAIVEDTGDARWLAGDRAGAGQAYREALDLREQLVAAGPSNGEFASNLVYTATHLAARLIEAGRVKEARAATGRALRLLRQQADAPTAAASRFTEYAWLLLVAQPADLRDPATALTYARRALDLPRGTNPDALAVFALAQHQTGDAAGAVATARRIYDMVPELRADRDDAALLRDIRGNFTRHPLTPLARPVWF